MFPKLYKLWLAVHRQLHFCHRSFKLSYIHQTRSYLHKSERWLTCWPGASRIWVGSYLVRAELLRCQFGQPGMVHAWPLLSCMQALADMTLAATQSRLYSKLVLLLKLQGFIVAASETRILQILYSPRCAISAASCFVVHRVEIFLVRIASPLEPLEGRSRVRWCASLV